MSHPHYHYRIKGGLPIEIVGELLFLAALAVESLHGRSALRMDGVFRLHKARRTCLINASTPVGRDIARVFTGLLTRLIGERSFKVRLTEELSDSGALRP
jgi:hypothetical protein